MKRRVLMNAGAAALLAPLAGCRRAAPKGGWTIREMRDSGWPAPDLVADALRRVEALNLNGPSLRAVIETNPDAPDIARGLERALARGPLHGIPVLVKDNLDTADAMRTTAGSLALLDAPAPERDASVVARLRAAGAVILGKANLSEWANLRSPRSTSGWSARGGLTLNPHDPRRTASGSSSGSAAAVAAGMVPAAIGTETNGSIVSPAACCGIVGLKPTVGLVSRAGIIPITPWQDTAGPMTRTVRDAALVLSAIAGHDRMDPFTKNAADRVLADYTVDFSVDALQGARLGIVRGMCGRDGRVHGVFEEALKLLREAGAVLVDGVEIPHRREAAGAAWSAMLTEFRLALNEYLGARGGPVRTLADVIAFNEARAREELAHFGQELFIEAEQRQGDDALAGARSARSQALDLAGPRGIDAALREHRLDALICATNDPAGVVNLARGDSGGRTASGPAAVAGYPHLTLPMGRVDGMPVGLSFLGAAWSERRLLAFGDAFERRHPARAQETCCEAM